MKFNSFFRNIENDIKSSIFSNKRTKYPFNFFIAFVMYSYISGPLYNKFFIEDEIKFHLKRLENLENNKKNLNA